jgi:hypothetical protein
VVHLGFALSTAGKMVQYLILFIVSLTVVAYYIYLGGIVLRAHTVNGDLKCIDYSPSP